MKRFYLLSVISLFSAGISAQEITGGERTLSADSIITSDARLDSIYQSLPEVMITGERPRSQSLARQAVYDLPRLIRDLPVDNAYDAVKELPGVTEMNGGLQLAGQGVTVILNGKVTTLSVEQLYTLLRSIPASRIEKAEVMYNAPARYQVRGALINVQLKQTADGPSSWQGELYGKYNQKHYEGFEERASLYITEINSQRIFFTRTNTAVLTLRRTKMLCTLWRMARCTRWQPMRYAAAVRIRIVSGWEPIILSLKTIS